MKYKVGDKVLIRSDLINFENFGHYSFVPDMEPYKGKICTIEAIDGTGYFLKEDGDKFFWTDEMIAEKVVEVTHKAEDYPTIDLNKPWVDLVENYKEKYMNIEQIKIIVPNKVVEVYFTDGLKEKMVCHEDDTFDLRNCLFLAFAKHMYKDTYTVEGIEYKANEMKLMKKYVKLVDTALKKHKNAEAAAEKAKAEEERVKATVERKKAKLAKYKARCKEKYRQKRIAEQTEAYVNAMMLYDQIMCGCEDCNCTLERTCDAACSDDLK